MLCVQIKMDIESPAKRIAYYFDDEIGLYTFNKGHPMRPFRMKITDELVKVGLSDSGLRNEGKNAML